MKTVYLISGPLGVGKSTVSKKLSELTKNSTFIEGDIFLHKTENTDMEWGHRLKDAWSKVLTATRQNLGDDRPVVVDFVVEDELEWFKDQLSDAKIKYVVLYADSQTVLDRLSKRGELQFKERSMTLLKQLKNDPRNSKYLYDTTNKNPDEIASDIIISSKFEF
jgi:gluconate kinase